MPFASDHTSTLIFDLGSECVKMGYAGDFHPQIIREDSRSLVQNSKIANFPGAVSLMDEYVRREMVDSIIVITGGDSEESQMKLLREISRRSICQSFFVLNSAISSIFGCGRTSGIVLECGAGSLRAAAVGKGRILEFRQVNKGSLYWRNEIAQAIRGDNQGKIDDDQGQADDRKCTEILESLYEENLEIEEYCKGGILKKIQDRIFMEVVELLDHFMKVRKENDLTKFGSSNAIVITGGMMRSVGLYNHTKNYLIDKYGASMNEAIAEIKGLDPCFTGASIFGMNNQTKLLFSTPAEYLRNAKEVMSTKMIYK